MSSQTSSLTIRVRVSDVQASMAQIKAIGNVIRQIAGPVAALTTVGGFTALAKSGLNLADTLAKVKQVIGGTVEEMAGMAYAAQQDELSMEQLQAGLKEFSKHLVATGQGGRNLREALLEQADIFRQMPDGAAKSTRAVDLFGRSGVQLIPFLNKGSEALAELFDRGTRLSGVNSAMAASADEFNDALADLKLASQGLAASLASTLLPTITKVITAVTEGIVRFREWTRESQTFKVAADAVAIGGGVLAARKLGSLAMSGIAALIGAGAIKNLSDFTAALKLLPEAMKRAASTIGRAAGMIGMVVTALVAAKKQLEMWRDIHKEGESEAELARQNETLAKSILKVAEARKEDGRISEGEFEAFQMRVQKARVSLSTAGASDALRLIAKDLNATNTGGSVQRFVWTKDELDLQAQLLEIEIGRREIFREKAGLSKELIRELGHEYERRLALAELQRIEDLVIQKRNNAADALEDRVISQLEYDRIDLVVRKELLAIDKERAAISESERQERMAEIRGDIRLSSAEKFDRLKALAATPQEVAGLGPNPGNLRDQFTVAFTDIRNEWGTWATQLAGSFRNVFDSSISSISEGISGLILQTKTWGQALTQIGVTILTSIVQAIVQMGVRWVLTQIMMAVAGKAIQASAIAASAPIAAAQSAVWATPATLATIATYGGAAAAAPGLIGLAQAIVATQTALTSVGFAQGGFTGYGGRLEPAGIVHRNEFVMPAESVQRIGLPALEAMRSGEFPASAGMPGATHVQLAMFGGEADAQRWANSQDGEVWFINMLNRHVHRFA